MSKLMKWGWGLVALGGAGLALWGGAGADALLLSAAPFALAGEGLRALSLSGAAGNALALVLYVLLCGAPVAAMFLRRRPGWMPVAASAYLFFLLFMMVNPAKIAAFFGMEGAGEDALAVQKAMLTGFFYILLLSWVLVRAALRREAGGLARSLIRLTWLAGALLILSVTCFDLATLKAALASASPDAWIFFPEAETSASADGFLAVVRFLAAAAPSAALLYALPAAMRLLEGCGRELFAAENAALARILSARARTAILTAVGCMLGRAALELALAHWASDVSVTAAVPLFELLAAVASALLARFMERGCAVYHENQMMI